MIAVSKDKPVSQRIVVNGAIIKDKKVLMIKRSDTEGFLPGYFDLVGGKVDLGEDLEDAVVREAFEESGIRTEPLRLHTSWSYVANYRGVDTQFFVFGYILRPLDSDIENILTKHKKDFKWVGESDLQHIQITDALKKEVLSALKTIKQEKPQLSTRKFILTGGPGSGKTSLINALSYLKEGVISETATDYILMQQALGVEAPWEDEDFQNKITKFQNSREKGFATDGYPRVFLDRSAIDCLAYLKVAGKKPSPEMLARIDAIEAREGYAKKVFLIKLSDHIEETPYRQESLEESLVIEKALREVYTERGYEVIDIEPQPLQERLLTLMQLGTHCALHALIRTTQEGVCTPPFVFLSLHAPKGACFCSPFTFVQGVFG